MVSLRVVSLRAFAAVLTAGVLVAAGFSVPANAQAVVPTLVAIRAAHHPGLDRLVFQFRGGLPAQRSVRYVAGLVGDGSGLPIAVAGNARLLVRFGGATGHAGGNTTYGPTRRTLALPGIIQVVNTGDFEAVLSFGVGVAKKSAVRLYTLRNPSRVVVDIATPYRTVRAKAYFLNSLNFNAGRTPYVRGVVRPVVVPGTAAAVLQRLFAGPTQGEAAAGLRFVGSGATGFSKVTINNGVARVYLTGGCSSGGSTFTVANEINPTLKQFASVRWVKIYDPAGHTQRPTGRSDSIPACLEP
ncbi:hypothetical protein Aph01nite_01680 [Acrocarpospora phusangensis]|uniref:GerMN domain-containing protein n=1 Tax=Acrocarpospora phusangensis TaxID=1070424 RepID=A0A919UL08_9ACTN|nr:GerMN domain-containing protein [Acrocarpospora phusangensis]GIH21858.1 hypothetical protein Aph01nite_01680 [Acrocarpospora phusangensis]